VDYFSNKIYFRHDKPRPYQRQLVDDIYNSISERRHLLAHAPTGLGKSDASISAALTYALDHSLTVFFLTPKISQHKIALDVVNGLAKRHKLDIRCTDFVGRRYSCIDPSLSHLDHDGFMMSCEKKRRNETCEFYRKSRGYSKGDESRANTLFEKILKEEYGSGKSHHDLIKMGETHSACPYEWMTKAAAVSDVIVADYFQLMIPKIREIFFKKTRKQMEKSIIIVDEAHNLAKRVRDQLSSSTNSFILQRAEKEMKSLGSEKFPLSSEYEQWAKKYLGGSDEILASKAMFNEYLGLWAMEMEELANFFEELGYEFIEKTNKKSACMQFSRFIRKWQEEESGEMRILRKSGAHFSISKRFLDPSQATNELNRAHSTILMSGTLRPLDMHRDIIGLDELRTDLKAYRSPFDEDNVMNVIADSTTTRFKKRDFDNYRRIADNVDRVIDSSPDGVALFFPSYNVMNAVLPLMAHKKLLTQTEDMDPLEVGQLLVDFSNNGGLLCGVQGGSLAEGIDYSHGEIKTIVIVGIALEEPTLEVQSLIEYYQDKFGKGWEYGYMYPAVIKALQAAGRGVRKESDRVAVVFMDERFNWKNYRTIMDDGRKFVVTSEPDKYVKFFWSGYYQPPETGDLV
jgi:DNA excision repair protein ERCC-2